MLAGDFKDKITVYAETVLTDAFGGKVKTFVFAFFDRAETTFQSGNEAMHGQMITADKSISLKVRYRKSKYNEKQVLEYNGDLYNIRTIDTDRFRCFVRLQADRIAPDSIKINRV